MAAEPKVPHGVRADRAIELIKRRLPDLHLYRDELFVIRDVLREVATEAFADGVRVNTETP